MSINNLLLDYELGESDEKRSKETLELVNKQILYLSTTIDDFKNFFNPDRESVRVNLKELVTDSYMIIDSSLKSAGIVVKNEIKQSIVIKTKRNDVIQVILNLIKNSMDAYKENNDIENREIRIASKESFKAVSILVKDSAGGIPSDIIEKIFDPYFSTKDKKNGTGLGLYMSKMIVEDHLDGELSVITKDKSTIFTLKLPKEML
jgi:C4-dicarboxylate-specific signal transduction histidine kinase